MYRFLHAICLIGFFVFASAGIAEACAWYCSDPECNRSSPANCANGLCQATGYFCNDCSCQVDSLGTTCSCETSSIGG